MNPSTDPIQPSPSAADSEDSFSMAMFPEI